MARIRIIIADSHFLSRKGLSVLLRENADFSVLAEIVSSSELVSLAPHAEADLIIIDYTSPGFSVDSLLQISKKFPAARLLAITELQKPAALSKALNSGVVSHLLKDCDADEIVEAIYKTANGERFLCGKIAADTLEEKSEAVNEYSCEGLNISEREMEIIKLIAEGCSNKEVADKLFLSTHTVTTHRKNIMNKLGINNTAGLVLFAVRENLVSPNYFLFANG